MTFFISERFRPSRGHLRGDKLLQRLILKKKVNTNHGKTRRNNVNKINTVVR